MDRQIKGMYRSIFYGCVFFKHRGQWYDVKGYEINPTFNYLFSFFKDPKQKSIDRNGWEWHK